MITTNAIQTLAATLNERVVFEATPSPTLFNADWLIADILDTQHPKAARFAEDIQESASQHLRDNPAMTAEEARLYALIGIIQQAYGIRFVPSVDDILSGDLTKEDKDQILYAASEISAARVS